MFRILRRAAYLLGQLNAGLATLLALLFGGLGLVLTLGMAVVVDRAASQHVRADVTQEVAGIASQMRDKLDREMFERWRDIQIAASLDSIRDPELDVDAKRAVITRLQATYPDYAIVALVSPDGHVVATSNRMVEGSDVSKREYFIHGRTGPFVGDVHDAIVLAKLLPQKDGEVPRFLDVAAPIVRKDGTFGGIVVAHLYWEWANKLQRSIFKPLNGTAGTEVLVVAKDGTVLLGPRSLQGHYLDLGSVKAAQAGQSGSAQELWPDGQMYFTGFDRSIGYRDYPGLGWTVLVREQLDEALAPARDIRTSIVKASLLAAFLTMLISIAIARGITQPLRFLTAQAEAAQNSPVVLFRVTRGYAEVRSLSKSLIKLFDERLQREDALTKAREHARRNETEARAKEASFRLLFQANPVPMYVVSTQTMRFLAANDAALSYYGFGREQFLSMNLLDIRPTEEHDRIRETIRTLGESYDADIPWRHQLHDGTKRQVLTSVRKLRYEGHAAALVAVIDITDRLVAEAELRRTQNFLAVIVESMPAMLVVKDAREGRFLLVNKAGEKLLGVPREELLGKNDYDFFPKDQADFFSARDREVVQSGEVQFIPEEPVLTRENGERLLATKKLAIRDDAGEPQFLLVMSEDITERRRAERRVAHMARHDTLTGLPNRVQFHAHLEAVVTQRKRNDQVAVLYLDLDGFKNVNDTLGHTLGDQLLLAAAQRLRGCVRESDFVARLGGDEFGIIQTIAAEDDAASAINSLATRLLASVREPFELDGQSVQIETSVGIAIAPGDGDVPETLLQNADIAVYRAKEEGRGSYRFFEPGMDAQVRARRSMEVDLREALAKNEFEIFYQPIVLVSSGKITGVEALLRWRHPTRGMVSPADFIPLAEETKLIVPLGEWVLNQACAEIASWPGHIRLAVNLSAIQFKNANVPETVVSALTSSGLSRSRLEVEITESTLLNESEKTLIALQDLRAMGVRISMDDFGTGYSSLSYLHKFPFDKIKIDQSFVRELTSHAESQAIVHAVIGLAATLGMTSTAEGVETEEQLNLLRAAGCQEAQGYLLGRPRPAVEIRSLIIDRQPVSRRTGSILP